MCAMRIMIMILLLVLAGCSDPYTVSEAPSPRECRALGVQVDDGDKVTGRVAGITRGSIQEVSARCQSPFVEKRGCTLVWDLAQDGSWRYWLWYVDWQAMKHEECHARYEEWRHVIVLEELPHE